MMKMKMTMKMQCIIWMVRSDSCGYSESCFGFYMWKREFRLNGVS